MGNLYHYTNGVKIEKILQSGILKLTPEQPKPREKRICWLSSHPTWEKTANKIVMTESGESRLLDQAGTEELCRGLFRFVINPETYPDTIYPWPRLGVEARISPKIKKRLLSRAKKANVKPEQWYGTLHEIDIAHTTLEQMVDGQWKPISFQDAQAVENGRTVVDAGALPQLPITDDEWNNV